MTVFLTPAQVAARWHVHPATVRALCRRRQLRAMRVGDTWRISVADVQAYEQRHTTETEAEQARTAARVRTYPTTTVTAVAGEYALVVPGDVPWRDPL